MTPAVSVILPTYNRREFLAPAIGSVFAQTWFDWELIIADDGSDEVTRAYLQGLVDPPRIRMLDLTHSGRPGIVRNAALAEARGTYIAFLDSDDLWLPRKLEEQLASLRAHPDRHWSYTRFALLDAAGNTLPERGRLLGMPAGWILRPLLTGETVIALPSVVVERTLLESVGAFDEALVMCEDDELWFRLAAASEADAIDAPLTLVRRHGQHGGSDVIAWRDRRRVFEKLLAANRGKDLEPLLRRLRAEMSAGLARSQAVAGERIGALRTIAGSAPHAWRYRQWWPGALRAAVRALRPMSAR